MQHYCLRFRFLVSVLGIVLLQNLALSEANEKKEETPPSEARPQGKLHLSNSNYSSIKNIDDADTCEDPKMIEALSSENKGRDVLHKAFDIWKHCAEKFGHNKMHTMELAVKAIKKLKGVRSVMISPGYNRIYVSTSPESISSSFPTVCVV